MTVPIPGYRQAKSYSCGFASTLMVARHFGVEMAATELYELVGTDFWGTSQTSIVRALRAVGLRANTRYDVDLQRISLAVDRGKVLIGYLGDAEHWLVIYGYGRSPDRVFVADPRPTHSECEKRWEEYGSRLGGFGIVCSSGQRADRARVPSLEPARGIAGPPIEQRAKERPVVPEAATAERRAVQLSFAFRPDDPAAEGR